MPSKKELKGIKKTKRKITPNVSKMADITYAMGDAITKNPIYAGNFEGWDVRASCPKINFIDLDDLIYNDKLLDCQTILQSWIQIIVSNSLMMLTDHQRLVIEEVILKSTPALEVSKKLKKNKTTISHSLYGIFIPEYGTFHGGSLKKLKTIIEKSLEYKNYLKLKKVLNSKPSEKYLNIFLEYSQDRRFSYILSQKLLSINPYIEEVTNEKPNTKATKRDTRLQF